MLQLLWTFIALNVKRKDVSSSVWLSYEFFKSFQVEHNQIDSLCSDLLSLSNCFQSRPDSFLELFIRKFVLFKQINNDVDDAGNEVVEFQKI